MGLLLVYDVLRGKIVKKLREHRACVRDVSWHPFEHRLLSTSVSISFCKVRFLLMNIYEHSLHFKSTLGYLNVTGNECPIDKTFNFDQRIKHTCCAQDKMFLIKLQRALKLYWVV